MNRPGAAQCVAGMLLLVLPLLSGLYCGVQVCQYVVLPAHEAVPMNVLQASACLCVAGEVAGPCLRYPCQWPVRGSARAPG